MKKLKTYENCTADEKVKFVSSVFGSKLQFTDIEKSQLENNDFFITKYGNLATNSDYEVFIRKTQNGIEVRYGGSITKYNSLEEYINKRNSEKRVYNDDVMSDEDVKKYANMFKL